MTILRSCRFTLLFVFFSPYLLWGQSVVSKRQLVILESGVDKIWGTYLCAVENPTSSPQKATFPILLPLEATEWQAQEGLTNEEIKLHPSGGLMVEKEFKPGNTLMGVAFLADGEKGKAELHFKLQQPLSEFIVMSPVGNLHLSSAQMEAKTGMEFSHQRFNSLVAKSLEPGQTLAVQISNIPIGRKFFWWLGGGFAGILLLASILLSIKTIPRGELEQDASKTWQL